MTDVSLLNYLAQPPEEDGMPVRAVLVAISTGDADRTERLLCELEKLLETAGGIAAAKVVQARSAPDARTFIGSGKTAELAALCQAGDIHLAVFDHELSPAQIRNLEDALGGDVRVIDRSMLILDIFALHAVSGEGKLQVEYAQLRYTVPRLTGKGGMLSRQGGGIIAMRGPGETKLETDRRHVRHRMQVLEEQLRELQRGRVTQRKQRQNAGILRCALAGYTNAGKSTLLNTLTGAGILAEDKLFATLDPTTRRFGLPDGTEILLTDTVGFIRNLPHHLVQAFHSTLEEITFADAVLVVVDASDPEYGEHLEVTRSLLTELNAQEKPTLYLFNKCDTMPLPPIPPRELPREDVFYLSAQDPATLTALTARLEEIAAGGKRAMTLFVTNRDFQVLAALYDASAVRDVVYTEEGAVVHILGDAALCGRYRKYEAEDAEK